MSKKIAKKIGDRHATIAVEIADLFLNNDRDRDRDLNFSKDRANALAVFHWVKTNEHLFFKWSTYVNVLCNLYEFVPRSDHILTPPPPGPAAVLHR